MYKFEYVYTLIYFVLQSGGFFIECGALDGERSSNTLWLETEKAWTGLLVEMDPSYYMQLRGKNRKSNSINACLSPHHVVVVKATAGHCGSDQGEALKPTHL